ncbi:MAG: hypothetical protein LBS74_05365 [Oscillospiraceae bacterium]|nr:hypothetical protein [Oscillospiraceae bacterium]
MRTLNRILSIVFVLCFVLAGCAKKPQESKLSGTLPDILTAIKNEANTALGGDAALPQTFDDPITAETCQDKLGLTPEEFTEYVKEAYVQNAAISSIAHQAALVKCKDAASASKAKGLIAKGFNSGKWICVRPEQSFVVDSGEYVYLVASSNEKADALFNAFKKLAVNVGERNNFYTFTETDLIPDGGDGGITLG